MNQEILIGDGKRPIITTHIDGSIHIVYVKYINNINNGIRYKKYHPLYGTSSEEIVTNTEAWWPHISISINGDVHIVWEKSRYGNGYIGYARKVSGLWKFIDNLNTNTNRAMMPRITTDSLNRAHIVFWKNVAVQGTLIRGQYTRIGLINNIPTIELNVDIAEWNANRIGDIHIINDIVHIFTGQQYEINHLIISESGKLTQSEKYLKPLSDQITKFSETCSVSYGLNGLFYLASIDAGSNLPIEILHMRSGGISLVTPQLTPSGDYVKSAGDKITPGKAYIIYADSSKKCKVISINSKNLISSPISISDYGLQHDGELRHCPFGVGAIDGGLWVAYQDNRNGIWNVYIQKIDGTICTPLWKCEIPLNGYKNDGCGNRILDSECNPCISSQCNFTITQ